MADNIIDQATIDKMRKKEEIAKNNCINAAKKIMMNINTNNSSINMLIKEGLKKSDDGRIRIPRNQIGEELHKELDYFKQCPKAYNEFYSGIDNPITKEFTKISGLNIGYTRHAIFHSEMDGIWAEIM
ncbi:MAG: hypothetical protein Satyrvirus8_13 [Satyrvirus sp.]|uniref:Uncharacterized protein n=1 Tax=Satyrvirus sp. TaxID=2487771 RepID=A0A3G5ADF2_9VIRU|nr:MAG: hypothetical protein Satyrvirus8_13 [Satyrvirus sp.]